MTPRPSAQRAARLLAPEWLPGVEPEFVRAFSNDVYRLRRSGESKGPFYLRVTSGAHRGESDLISELEFVQNLAAAGVAVSAPVPSRGGRLVHAAEIDGETFRACVFEEAPGVEFESLSPAEAGGFFRLAGRTMGHLHRAADRFVPSPGFHRPDWRQDRWERFAELVPEREREAWRLFRELQAWTGDLPRDAAAFGMIHGDFTILNMRFHGGRITLFDFDSCCEHWRGYEIATFLHYFGGGSKETRKKAYEEVLGGYTETGTLTESTIDAIPLFGKMRLLYSFLVFAETWGFESLSPEQEEYFALRRRLFEQEPTWPAK